MKACVLALLSLLCCAGHAAAPPLPDLAAASAPGSIALDGVQRSATLERAADGVAQRRYVFAPTAHSRIVLTPASGAWHWASRGELRLRVQNAMPWAVTLRVEIEGVSAGERLTAIVGIPAGPAQELVVPLAATSPRALGMQAGPPMPFTQHGRRILLATTVTGRLERGQVRAISLQVPAPEVPQALWFGRLESAPGATLQRAYAGIVDRYGQYTRADWPQKIDSDEALRAAAAATPAAHRRVTVDRYGGSTVVSGLHASGWFHAQKQAGRWQLVTPAGHGFFSLGMNAVTAEGGRSYVQGREFMFAGLPPDAAPWAAFYGRSDSRRAGQGASAGVGDNHGRWFDFHAANLFRIDGDDWLQAWRSRTLARLEAWGFNTIGNWSDPALGRAHRLPYTRSINVAGDYASVSSGEDYWGRMPDPFDPRFAHAAEAAAARATAGVRDDPWLLGYFADNELAWAGSGEAGRWGLARGTLAAEARSPAKQAFIAQLKKAYAAPQALAAAWGVALTSWEELDATGFAAPLPDAAHPAIARDYSAWLRRYADTYFRVVVEALRRHDPHHLFLGGRFAATTPEAIAACARYCDVLSFNVYSDLPQHGLPAGALRQLDKPVLISEFQFGSADRGPFGAGVVAVAAEAQRGEAYARFVEAAVADPRIVGAHWFQYVDQPVTGRLLDGENSHVGLVGITDIPYGDFVRAVRAANDRAAASGGLPNAR